MSRWVGIDPSATATGMAANIGVWNHYKYPIEKWSFIQSNLRIWKRHWDATHLMIEGQFVGLNPRNALLLATIKGRIVQMAVELGYEVQEVEPKKWQKEILGVPGNAKTAERKAASIAYVKTLGVDTEDDNIADAICIALYAERMFG